VIARCMSFSLLSSSIWAIGGALAAKRWRISAFLRSDQLSWSRFYFQQLFLQSESKPRSCLPLFFRVLGTVRDENGAFVLSPQISNFRSCASQPPLKLGDFRERPDIVRPD
jgi:hypothetical protein